MTDRQNSMVWFFVFSFLTLALIWAPPPERMPEAFVLAMVAWVAAGYNLWKWLM